MKRLVRGWMVSRERVVRPEAAQAAVSVGWTCNKFRIKTELSKFRQDFFDLVAYRGHGGYGIADITDVSRPTFGICFLF